MIKLLTCFCLAIAPLAPLTLQAQDQQELNQQAIDNFKTADAELNKVYKQLVSKIDSDSRAILLKSQKAWIQFRDAEAHLMADFNARGGSMFTMIYEGTRASLTKERTKQLKLTLKQYGGN